MAKKKKVVKEPKIIYFIDNGRVIEGTVLLETELHYLVSYNAEVNRGWVTIDVNAEKLVSIDDAFEYYNDCTTELRLRNLETKQKNTITEDRCRFIFRDVFLKNKPWYKRIFN